MQAVTKSPQWLLDHAHNVYSQSGEDGIIRKILDVLPTNNKWCVEFGAWDGKHLSNVRNLILEFDYNALLIEASRDKYEELVVNYQTHKNVITLNQYVNFLPEDNLDTILSDHSLPFDFDLLSVDVDGNDYHILAAMQEFKPKVVCVEFNPTIPSEVHFVQKADVTINQGSSLLSLTELMRSKGYELICVLNANAFFVVNEYFPLFEITDNSPSVLRRSHANLSYIFSGFDGQMFLVGSQFLPWHDLEIDQNKLQQIPKYLRKYPLNYSPFQTFLFKLYRKKLSLSKKIKKTFFG